MYKLSDVQKKLLRQTNRVVLISVCITLKTMFYKKAKRQLKVDCWGDPTDQNITRKDFRKRTWPSGENDTEMKKQFSRIIRRKLKRGVEIADGNAYRKFNCSYDINDFK